MKNTVLRKCAMLAFLCALLLIPLSMIERTIDERTGRRAQAIQSIASSTAGAQSIIGPVMTVPVEEEFDEEQGHFVGGQAQTRVVRSKRSHNLTVLPRVLHLDGALKVEKRAYGLHSAAVFELQGSITGNFESPSPAALGKLGKNAHLTWGTPTISVGILDTRGIAGAPKIELAGQAMALRRGTANASLKTGFHAQALTPASGKPETLPFRIEVNLIGTGTMGFVPLGGVSTAELRGNWPHPSFGGDFLPRQKATNADGFSARWSTTGLASNSDHGSINPQASGFQVRLIEPVDIYQQATRAVKYGVLFVVLTFAAFFVFENLKNLPIHPIQYLLLGLAQAVFFLLLTSLSEHIDFFPAYVASATASIALIGIYLAAILRGWLRALGFSVSLALLYAALLGILRSEQNAFLLGSILLFVALASLMLSTRGIDWYRLGRSTADETYPDDIDTVAAAQ